MGDISRRDFIKAGAGALVLGSAAAACKSGSGVKAGDTEVSEGMPLRTNPNTGDKVSRFRSLAMAACGGP